MPPDHASPATALRPDAVSQATQRDWLEIQDFLAARPGVRMLHVVTGTNAALALDVALVDRYLAGIASPTFIPLALGEVDDFDSYLERLAGAPPSVAVSYYSKPVQMNVAAGDTSSETYRRRDRFLKLERLHACLNRLDVPIVMECGDLHSRLGVDHFYGAIRKWNVFGLIVNNRGAIDLLWDELGSRGIRSVQTIIWQPLGIDPALHRDYGEEKRHNFVMYGRIDEAFRRRLVRHCRLRQLISFGRFGFTHLRRNTIDGDNLFVEVNRARAAFAAHQSGGVYRGRPIGMTYAKYFEIPACRTLLVGQPTPDLEHLGLVDGETYVAVTPGNYRRRLWQLARELRTPRVQEMTDRAFRLVHERHRIGQHMNDAIRQVVEAVAPGARAEPSA